MNGPAVDIHETALCPAGAAFLRVMLAPLAWNIWRIMHALLQLVEDNPAALGGRCMDRTRYTFCMLPRQALQARLQHTNRRAFLQRTPGLPNMLACRNTGVRGCSRHAHCTNLCMSSPKITQVVLACILRLERDVQNQGLLTL